MTRPFLGFCAAVVMSMVPMSGMAVDPVTIVPSWDDPGPDSSEFGRALAVTGKFLYVGAPKFNLSAGSTDAGRVFIYDQKTLEYSSLFATGFDSFAEGGAALSATKKEVLMAAPGRILSGVAQGQAALISEKSDHVVFSNPAPAHGDRFGAAVAADKKLVVIGAPGDVGGPGGHVSGSAFVALRKDNVLVRLLLPSYEDGDRAGAAVALSKKFIAVGAPGTANPSPNAGVVHIYDAKDFSYILTLTGSVFSNTPRFGSALAFAGDSLYVGAPTGAYGSPTFPGYISDAGNVYEFNVEDWALIRTYNSLSQQSGAGFGASIAVDKKNLIIGSPTWNSPTQTDCGLAEVFDVKLHGWKSDLVPIISRLNGEFGKSIALLKKKRVAVGAPSPGDTFIDGRVHVFTLPR